MFEIPGCAERFVKAYKQYDPFVADDFFVKSSMPENINHTEGLAVFLNEVLLA